MTGVVQTDADHLVRLRHDRCPADASDAREIVARAVRGLRECTPFSVSQQFVHISDTGDLHRHIFTHHNRGRSSSF